MEYCKPAPYPFQSRVKLSSICTSPKVDSTLYRHLVGSPLYLNHSHPNGSFVIGHVAHYMQTPYEIRWKA